ncbi:hypothetical protein [Mucilaginibacter sp.]|uniref:hypothetical protein n=1 Tax=Mucilaginibacter sp. TaxID=1882438 RepID=UPI0025E1D417|nr:hypothetical protein [Mucilaginibacter sp.]
MDITLLAQTAVTLATPFLSKIGEGTSRKIGEDIWGMIKDCFTSKGKEIDENNPAQLQSNLEEILAEDESFKLKLEDYVAKNQPSSVQQNVQNNAAISKQVNITSNSGDLHF